MRRGYSDITMQSMSALKREIRAGTVVVGLIALAGLLALAPSIRRSATRGVARAAAGTELPTLYKVDISKSRRLQLYLDPGLPGLNGIHATFFDAQGSEAAIAGRMQIAVSGRTSPPALLPVFQEGPGHFYSNFNFPPGAWRLEITARDQAGQVLRTYVIIHL
jgi:hypothetical protein